jgi:serine-aspartate repeat-containing protein C/D/E
MTKMRAVISVGASLTFIAMAVLADTVSVPNSISNAAMADEDELNANFSNMLNIILLVASQQPPPPVPCVGIKPITELSMVWNGAGLVDIVTPLGGQFIGVAPGNQITFSTVGVGNDVELRISGAVNGSSEFHISCSDPAMNGSDDCGSNQGDGKSNESFFINTWLFDGMTGENDSFACMLPNTGVVDPDA